MAGWVVLLLAIWFGWPTQWGGNTTYVVVNGTSMEPNYHTGDIVIARRVDEPKVGDVVVYSVPDDSTGAGKLIMHRLIRIEADGRYVIQGDNRDTPDQFDVGPENVVGVARLHIPKVGNSANLLGKWWFIAGLVGLYALVHLWPDDEEEDEDVGADVALDDEPDGADGLGQDELDQAQLDAIWAATTATLPTLAPPSPDAVPVDELPSPVVGAPLPPPRPVRPPVRPQRAQVIVDGDGLARSRWGQLPLLEARQRAMEAADAIGTRFGTSVAMVFEDLGDELVDRHHAHVVWVPEDQSLVDVIRTQLDGRAGGAAVLVVTDAEAVAEQAWSQTANVMRCSAWLSLGASVGAATG